AASATRMEKTPRGSRASTRSRKLHRKQKRERCRTMPKAAPRSKDTDSARPSGQPCTIQADAPMARRIRTGRPIRELKFMGVFLKKRMAGAFSCHLKAGHDPVS